MRKINANHLTSSVYQLKVLPTELSIPFHLNIAICNKNIFRGIREYVRCLAIQGTYFTNM